MKREKNGTLTLATLRSWIRLQMFSFLLRKLPSFRNSVFFSCLEASLNARTIVSEKKTGRKWCWKLSADCIYHFIFHIVYKSFSIHPNKFDTPWYTKSSATWKLFLLSILVLYFYEMQFVFECTFMFVRFFLAIISVVKNFLWALFLFCSKTIFTWSAVSRRRKTPKYWVGVATAHPTKTPFLSIQSFCVFL